MLKGMDYVMDEDALNLTVKIAYNKHNKPNFSNAREVRNILEKAVDKHALNIMRKIIGPEDRYVLRDADFRNLKLGGIAAGMEGLR